jgi:hypothetical protein
VLTAALALVALPGLVGSRSLTSIDTVPAGAFQQLSILAGAPHSTPSIGGLDDAHASAETVGAETPIREPAASSTGVGRGRPNVDQPRTGASSIRTGALSATLPAGGPKRSVSGGATFYDNGTTAMRLPRGTIVKICGNGGCIVRVVNDYGPQKKSRVVDLFRPDFFAICGCPSWSGTTQVTVYIY